MPDFAVEILGRAAKQDRELVFTTTGKTPHEALMYATIRECTRRRVSMAEAAALQKQAHHAILLTGVAISFCSTVPLLNLAAPLVGVAAMLHPFHALRGTAKQEILPPR